MRTTLTLDDDVAHRLKDETRRQGKSLKAVVNSGLRAGLGMLERTRRPSPFRVEPHAFGFKPGVDLDKLNQIVDELEATEEAGEL